MRRRDLLGNAAVLSLAATLPSLRSWANDRNALRRVRPGDAAWPSAEQWDLLKQNVRGNLFAPLPLLADCERAPTGSACLKGGAVSEKPVLPGGPAIRDAGFGLARRLVTQAERIRSPGRAAGGYRRCRKFCTRSQSAPRNQGWRAQLPGNIQRTGLTVDLDSPHA
jgi:hypothetical protein